MKKPEGYDAAIPVQGGDFKRVLPGAYVLRCIGSKIEKSKNGKDMLVTGYDINEGQFAGFYKEKTEKFKKNSWLMSHNILEGDNVKFLKGLITSFEESNAGFKAFSTSNELDEKSLFNKLVGANLREEEYLDGDGKVKTSIKIAHFCSVETVKSGKLQALPKKTVENNAVLSSQTMTNDDLPF